MTEKPTEYQIKLNQDMLSWSKKNLVELVEKLQQQLEEALQRIKELQK